MDKRILQIFAYWAKEHLENQVEISLKTLGINSEKDISEAKIVGDFTIIDGDQNSYDKSLYEKRKKLVNLIKTDGYKETIKSVAYTWFNRLVSLRYMEVHNFLPHGFRVLSSTTGGIEPEILKNINFVKDELHLDIEICNNLKRDGDIESLFSYVLFKQCNELSRILPMIFESDNDYMELLLPKSLLKGTTIITKLLEIPEEYFLNDVEVIGWLYQFYVSDKREEYRKLKSISTKEIPTLTQIFTPDWIVRYMVQNSLGRLWLKQYPNSKIKDEFEYYVDDVREDKNEQFKGIENIKIMEPCSGSGHILVYIFDLLYKMYEELGYQPREIPSLILRNNLYGLEIDKRAAQLSNFSLIMKARTLNNKFFTDEYYVEPKVYEIPETKELIKSNYKKHLIDSKVLDEEEIKSIDHIVTLFEEGKTIGSLIKVHDFDYQKMVSILDKLKKVVVNIFNTNFYTDDVNFIYYVLDVAKVMSNKYDIMVTNPPYLGISKLQDNIKDYFNKNYPNSKSDMFAMFMDTNFVDKNGYYALVNPDSWMFLLSFEKLRYDIIKNRSIVSLMHLGLGAFDATVQTVSFVMKNTDDIKEGVYIRLVNSKDKEKDFANVKRYIYPKEKYLKIKTNPIAYWISDKLLKIFEESPCLIDVAVPRQGFATGDNDKFLRFWFEVNLDDIELSRNEKTASESTKKWFPCNKGGAFRKWYGNNERVANWENNGYEMKHSKGSVIRNSSYYFKEAGTWSTLSSANFSMRYCPEGYLFESKGSNLFPYDRDNLFYIIGLLNSNIVQETLRVLSPTLDYNQGPLGRVPIKIDEGIKTQVEEIVKENISIEKEDWDDYEISYDFTKNPLLKTSKYKYGNSCLEELVDEYIETCKYRFDRIKENEEKLNELFINLYGLEDEITPKVENKDVSISVLTKDFIIQNLLSYIVGLVFGRYSVDKDGIVLSSEQVDNKNYKNYIPDEDGIIQIYNSLGMNDSLSSKIIELIKLLFGEANYIRNIDYIAECLKKGANESSEETLNRYLQQDFYDYHVGMFSKCPIYWQFSSGKNAAFKCLIYMNRFNEDTLARINSKYLLPESTRIKIRIEELKNIANSLDGKEKIKIEKELETNKNKYDEINEYGQVLDHMANKFIKINIDKGVKSNYQLFQNIEYIDDNGKKVKKDLLQRIQ